MGVVSTSHSLIVKSVAIGDHVYPLVPPRLVASVQRGKLRNKLPTPESIQPLPLNRWVHSPLSCYGIRSLNAQPQIHGKPRTGARTSKIDSAAWKVAMGRQSIPRQRLDTQYSPPFTCLETTSLFTGSLPTPGIESQTFRLETPQPTSCLDYCYRLFPIPCLFLSDPPPSRWRTPLSGMGVGSVNKKAYPVWDGVSLFLLWFSDLFTTPRVIMLEECVYSGLGELVKRYGRRGTVHLPTCVSTILVQYAPP
ncbi:hypothetical protein VNI00_019179 [Paramarasmius palmivorus]|uniref:Uncharacterized protein n=1 Tax=Paramarasmius palmivorus TaxID=297713 RepID=A0AAW0AQG1_9AGAR